MEIARESKKTSPFLWQNFINNLERNWRSKCPAWSKVLLFEKVESVLRLYKPSIALREGRKCSTSLQAKLAARGRPSTMVTAREASRDAHEARNTEDVKYHSRSDTALTKSACSHVCNVNILRTTTTREPQQPMTSVNATNHYELHTIIEKYVFSWFFHFF